MLNHLIRFSLGNRLLILGAAALLLVVGGVWTAGMSVDVFPDLSAPTVTVITEGRGMPPEEIESLVTFPLESGLNGAPGVRRVRSVSGAGISVIWVEFAWGEDIYRARQVVAERVQSVRLPSQVDAPALGPISSIMGEIAFVAVTSSSPQVSQVQLRRLAEGVMRRALLAIPGVSQVVPIGGDRREYQVEVDPSSLLQHGVGLDDVADVLSSASRSPAAGFYVDQGEEYLVRGVGRVRGAADLAEAVLQSSNGTPRKVSDVAAVLEGHEPKRGTASYKGAPAVILSVQKQPAANTLDLTRKMDRVLAELAKTLPEGVVIEKENFRQADFIDAAVGNVSAALRDGAVLVVVILFFFLGNLRATLISAIAIPISLVAGVLIVSWLGGNLNTMTIGGLTIAIGALVDDAIIDVENVLRRLREERRKSEAQRRLPLHVVFAASSEVRNAIFFATLIIVLVLLPLFVLPGFEGRLLRPLGLAYVAALAASLLVSLTVTPVLCLMLLGDSKVVTHDEPRLMLALKAGYRRILERSLKHPGWVLGVCLVLLAGTAALFPSLGRSFLPPFNEGSLTVAVVSPPGITLEQGDALGREVERALLAFPEVVSTSRRTGRAERDEHVQGVNASEMEVVLRPGRPKNDLLAAMRRAVATIPGAQVSFGQPISHRIDHMISGSKSNLAVKIFGSDLSVLRSLAAGAERILRGVPGIADLGNTEQASVPQLLIEFDRPAMARFGVSADSLSRTVEALFQGAEVGEVLEDGIVSRVVVRYPASLRLQRDRLDDLPVTMSKGIRIRLGDVARVRFDLGPSLIRRENVQRVAMLTANIAGVDLAGTVEAAQRAIASGLTVPPGYRIEYGGQFEEGARSVRNLAVLSVLILAAMYGLLYAAFRNHRYPSIVLVNLPLALIGGVVALVLGNGVLSIASMVGFITLFGIATRNGVLLVTHYQHLLREEGLSLPEAVRRGSIERLAPVLMTALTAGLALIPLIIHGSAAGNEIQSPMAQVILGGLISSTFLNMIVVPALFARWGGVHATVPAVEGPTKT